MIYCKHCVHWMDESLEQIEADRGAHTHIFMGCRISANTPGDDTLESCKHYQASRDTFTICSSCRLTVPKLCVSLGECSNCTDTDLFCVDSCIGGEGRKYCTHFVRLQNEGAHLVENNRVFDLFPSIGMPGQHKSDDRVAPSKGISKKDSSGKSKAPKGKQSRTPKKP